MSDYPMLISNKLHSFRNFELQVFKILYPYRVYSKSIIHNAYPL